MAADPSIGERSHVLVLGARGGAGCPERLVRRLLDRALSEEEGGPADAPFHWTLTTKYYRAELSLHVRHAEPGATPTSEALDVGEEPHGVILVVDGPKAAAEGEAGLEPWRPWLEAVAERGPELCLCVAVVPGEGDATDSEDAAREKLVRERTLWCLESGFEYVEVDSSSLSAWGQQEEQGQAPRRRLPSELREKEGMERVRESIEATPWPTLVRLPRDSGDRAAAAAVSAGPGQEGGGGLDEECKNTAASMGKSVERAEAEGGTDKPHGAAAAAEAGAAEWEEGLGAGGSDDLEALFDRIRVIRESARQGNGAGAGVAGGLADEEWRARAAEAALKLAELLGLGEEEEEEEEEDG